MQQALIIFVKNPVLGKVKTRLAASIGDRAALEAYRDLIRITANVCAPLAGKIDLHVFYSDHIDETDAWSSIKCTKHVQHPGPDLGLKMKKAFEALFCLTYNDVVIIGSDCPYLDTTILETTFKELTNSDLVIGPSLDGGFYLLGVHSMDTLNFEGIKWSTDSVYQNYMKNCHNSAPLKFTLPILEDVDELESFERFKSAVSI